MHNVSPKCITEVDAVARRPVISRSLTVIKRSVTLAVTLIGVAASIATIIVPH